MADGSMTTSRVVRLCHATLTDIDMIAPHMRGDEIEQFLAITGWKAYDPMDAARVFAAIDGPSWTLADHRGMPLVVGGIEPVRGGVGRPWMMGTMKAWDDYGWQITRVCRRLFGNALAGGHYQRLEILALPERRGACEWYSRGLGFEYEGIRRKYINGHDFVAYVKFGG